MIYYCVFCRSRVSDLLLCAAGPASDFLLCAAGPASDLLLCAAGQGAAMIIESLQLYYHVHCFRCCVCCAPLGTGERGADVRVRLNKLHCQNCYSNDEGSRLSNALLKLCIEYSYLVHVEGQRQKFPVGGGMLYFEQFSNSRKCNHENVAANMVKFG